MINFIIEYTTLYEKIHDIFVNMSYIVCYHFAKTELKTPLVHGEKTNYVRG
jgi:hypothetical protein